MSRMTPKQRINIAVIFLIAAVVQFMQGVNELSKFLA